MSSDSMPSTQPGPSRTVGKSANSFFQNSPQLSQITMSSQPEENTGRVAKRLFGSAKMSSTPFHSTRHAPDLINTPGMPMLSQIVEEEAAVPEPNIRKRRLDELFGDLTDIPDDDFETDNIPILNGMAKKTRTEEEIDTEMIELILIARAENQAKSQRTGRPNRMEQLENLRKFKAQNLSQSYPKWPCIPVVNDDQDRLYVRMHSEEFEVRQLSELNFQKSYGNLLGDGSATIWNEAQQIVQKRMMDGDASQAIAVPIVSELSVSSTDKLWVEKYRPESYVDLLSDESTNRSLLTWLRMWDKAVFKREFKLPDSHDQGPANFFNKRTGKFELGFRKKPRKNDLQSVIDEHGRPVQRVAILCGPPGLGKTTLAHMIAKHAGYAVREMNASDDRSLDAFKLILQNSTQMQTTLLSQDGRPNCIILDEIDGAPTASIEFLVKFINEQVKEKGAKATAAAGDAGGKKAAKKALLRRPIICICNDIYTPALRTLRQMAFVVTFPPLDSVRLAERLLNICYRERLKSDMTTLTALAEKSGNDIRSCISVLQFYANSNQTLTLTHIIRSNVGLKDKQRGLFEIWNTIFQVRKRRVNFESASGWSSLNEKTEEVSAPGEISMKTRVDTVLDSVHSGDYDRLTTGVYENYLAQKMPDPNMVGVAQASHWFCFTDSLNSQIQHKQNYTVYPYLQYGFIVWHMLFASTRMAKIKFPVQSFEHSQKVTLRKTVCVSFLKNLSSNVRCLGNGQSMLLDTVSFIRHILSPSLRFVSLQLLTAKERHDLKHTVDVMVDLGLHYNQLRVADGTYQYQLEPDINLLCQFIVSSSSMPLTYFNMQLIAREVEVEAMRRSMPKATAITDASQKNGGKKAPPKFDINSRLQPKAIVNHNNTKNIKESVSKDFFGRITTKKIDADKNNSDMGVAKSRVWYHFKEGFNNAVRKDVTMQKLL